MAKPIYMTDDDFDSVMSELRSLIGKKCYGSIDIKKSLGKDTRSAAIYFTPEAWIKMTSLVARFTTEVQWHGLVERVSEAEFRVFDIIVPPHEVSGTTVTSDYAKYTEWVNDLDDDTFNHMRFHGHSHVDMDVTPSSVDNKYRMDVVTQLPKPVQGEDVFYIFMIMNKSHSVSAEIYDLTNNALYETSDIIVDIDMETDLEGFVNNAKKVAVTRTYTYTGNTGSYAGKGAWDGRSQPAATSTPKQPTSVTPVSQVTGSKNTSGKNKGGKAAKCSDCAFYDYCKLHTDCKKTCDDYSPLLDDDDYGGYGYPWEHGGY